MNWTCPHCNNLNDEEYVRCVCGYEDTEEEQQVMKTGVEIPTVTEATSGPTAISPGTSPHASKLKRAFWISFCTLAFSMAFLFIARNYPQLILGPAPTGPQGLVNKILMLNYVTNKSLLKDIAEGAVFWTCIVILVLFFCARNEEKSSK